MNFPQPVTSKSLIKICGITREDDALLALELGASFLGIILTTKSARHVSIDRAEALLSAIRSQRPDVRPIGVFVDESPELMAQAYHRLGLVAVQVHGATEAVAGLMGPEAVIPAIAVRDAAQATELGRLNARHPAVLADSFSPGAHGGTGKVFNHELVRPLASQRPILIAGGLGPDNIADVVARLGAEHQPYAYDLSSGVESTPGTKDHGKLRRFFAEFGKAQGLLIEGRT